MATRYATHSRRLSYIKLTPEYGLTSPTAKYSKVGRYLGNGLQVQPCKSDARKI